MRTQLIPLALCASALLLSFNVTAAPLPDASTKTQVSAVYARDSAQQPAKGQWTVGVFNPLEIGLTDKLSLVTNPLLLVASPNATVRYHVGDFGGWSVTASGGLSVPRLAMTAPLPLGLAGWFFPACKVTQHDPDGPDTCDQAGWVVVPSLGAMASMGSTNVTTLRAEVAVGLALSGELGRPLEHIPPADLLFAPATYGWRARLGARHDRQLLERLRVSGEVNLYWVGESEAPTRSPWTATAHLGLDLQLTSGLRLTAGVLLTNSDQRATEVVEEGATQCAARAARRTCGRRLTLFGRHSRAHQQSDQRLGERVDEGVGRQLWLRRDLKGE